MIRASILAAAMAVVLGAAAKADGFEPGREPGYGGPRPHRVVYHRRPHHGLHRHARHAYGYPQVGEVAPGRLTENPNVPVYNIPPRRFP